MSDSAKLLEFSARALRASSAAGAYAATFAVIFIPFLFVTILGLLPLSAAIVDFTVKLLGIPFGGSIFSVGAFWSLIVYLAVFVHRMAGKGAPKTRRPQDVLFGSLAILAFCAGLAHLLLERRTEGTAQDMKALVLDFVQHNDVVMRDVGGNGKVSLVSSRTERDGSGMYDIRVSGAKTIYAIVDASREAPSPRLTLVCTTPLYIGQRDPFKHPCKQ